MDLSKIGMSLITDFVSVEEEIVLLQNIEKKNKKNTKGRNSIKRYGSSLPYPGNIVSKEIPEFLKFLIARLPDINPNSVTVNEYLEGQKIPFHIDSPGSGPIIASLSLMNPAAMVFKLDDQEESVSLPARSLIKIQGEARQKWKHSIRPVTQTRYSIVFRHGT